MPRPHLSLLLCAALLPATLLASCGGDDAAPASTPMSPTTPTTQGSTTKESRTLAAPRSITKNTVRIDAADPSAVAAQSALTMYPSTAKDLRPDAVAFAGADDWRSMLLASSFAAKPLGFPLLLVDGTKLSPVTEAALAQLQPQGSRLMNMAQGLRLGVSSRPGTLRTRSVTATTPAGLSLQTDRQLTKARKRASSRVLIVNSDDAKSAAPAAAWAARSGDPILFVGKGNVPAETKQALLEHQNPKVYVMGDEDVVSSFVVRSLQEIPGVTVYRIQPDETNPTPSDLSIEFARYSDGLMGFNYRSPGHSFVLAPANDPLMALAASTLSSGGNYPAMLYVDRPDHVEAELRAYLLSVQPGYDAAHPATQGFYNRGWLIGPTTAIETSTQSRIDQLMEIVPTDEPNALGDAAETDTATEATPDQ
ncbi:MAG: cell wall-binding repeat-containing protein [Solirubrobacteraceae bacterium]|nr:cell wall-binding repeat-containing protein [Solirubrobacteraceae bacterium]